MKQTYKETGMSITSASMSTIGATLFLLGGTITSFFKVVIIIDFCVALNFTLAVVLFGAIMHMCGPQMGFGDIFSACKDTPVENDQDFDDI